MQQTRTTAKYFLAHKYRERKQVETFHIASESKTAVFSEDVWYTGFPNGQQFFQLLKYYAVTLATADRLRHTNIDRDRARQCTKSVILNQGAVN